MRFQNEQVVFNIFEARKHRNENPQCYWVDVIDSLDWSRKLLKKKLQHNHWKK